MELRIDQNVLDRFPSLHIVQENDVVTVKFDGENNSDFLFPMNLPMTNLDHISWRRVDEIAKAGKAREYFALGATKKDYMKNGFVATYQIIGFDHDDLADDSGKAPISWDMVSLYKDEAAMCKDGNSVWWNDADIRSFLNGDFKNPCADDTNHKCNQYYTEQDDGLTKNWGGKQFFVILHILVRQNIKVVRKIGLKNVIVRAERMTLLL